MQQKSVHYIGLTDREVSESRRKYGENILTPPAKKSLFIQFLEKFKDPLILILLVAGALSVVISLYEYFGLREGSGVFFEPTGIFIAIILATGLSFYFENKADKEFALLNQVSDEEPVTVIRNGEPTQVQRREVVVDDIVIINTGEEIPADGELLESVLLNVDESTLTGEPLCHKSVVEADFDADATFPSNHVMRGTKVMEGHGVMRVTAVGDATENGRVYEAVQITDNIKTPLDEQFERLGHLISIASYIIGAMIIVVRIIMYLTNTDTAINWMSFGAYVLQSIMIAVTLVVCSVPEGLPMAVTLALAYSMRRMLKTNNLVRKMHACETMGATTVICTDKTGTLTQNRMQIADVKPLGDMTLLRENMAVNSTAQLDTSSERTSVLGNPTEGALLLWLRSEGYDYRALRSEVRIIDEVPFSTERKYMATVVENAEGKKYLFVKGAPEIVYAMATHADIEKTDLDKLLLGYQNQAMRTLGFAYAEILSWNNADISNLRSYNLIFQGVTAISDPVRPEVPAAVAEAIGAGIKIKIVTGDTPATAREIGRQVGLWDDNIDSDKNIITGPEFAKLSDDELVERVEDMKIIARARPLDKKRLVEALQKRGEVVAVTGDGTNDAPALKAAQVGLSMGDGTSVAKEASDITIVDNSFSSIGRAVMWGRSLFQNIRRFIVFQMTINLVACLIVLVGAVLGTQSPLTVTQMLWVNLIMDTFAAMAMAALPPTKAVMADKPRRRTDFIINAPMRNFIIGIGSIFFVMLLGLLLIFDHNDITSLTQLTHIGWGVNKGLSAYELSLFFTIFVFLQFWNMFNARAFATGRSALHLGHCSEFGMIASMIFVGQIVIVQLGGDFFNVAPLKLTDWIIIISGTSIVLWTGEIIRVLKRVFCVSRDNKL